MDLENKYLVEVSGLAIVAELAESFVSKASKVLATSATEKIASKASKVLATSAAEKISH